MHTFHVQYCSKSSKTKCTVLSRSSLHTVVSSPPPLNSSSYYISMWQPASFWRAIRPFLPPSPERRRRWQRRRRRRTATR